jgi:hypothetical protein
MELDETKKHIRKIFTLLITRLVDASFTFPGGSTADRVLESVHHNIVKNYGEVTPERLVDYLITTAYRYRNQNIVNAKAALGNASFVKYKAKTTGQDYYQNQWLASAKLTKEDLIRTINKHGGKHPLADYIYLSSEEPTKRRFLNTIAGYLLCTRSTLGWSPFSPTCRICTQAQQCEQTTQKKNRELYRIRKELWQQQHEK